MRAYKFVAVFAAILFVPMLAGCAGAVLGNPQGYAGITNAKVEVCETDNGQPYVCEAAIVDGKDKQDVALNIAHPSGWRVSYLASGVKAVEAIKVRGAVEEAVSADVKDAAPGIVDSIVTAVLRALGP